MLRPPPRATFAEASRTAILGLASSSRTPACPGPRRCLSPEFLQVAVEPGPDQRRHEPGQLLVAGDQPPQLLRAAPEAQSLGGPERAPVGERRDLRPTRLDFAEEDVHSHVAQPLDLLEQFALMPRVASGLLAQFAQVASPALEQELRQSAQHRCCGPLVARV